MNDHVEIRIPPATPFVGLARSLAGGLGARLDFTYDQIMDLHIAIDEVCSRLLATTEAPEALVLRFTVEEGQLSFEARADGTLREDREFLNPMSRMILEALVDRFDIVEDPAGFRVQVEVQRAGT